MEINRIVTDISKKNIDKDLKQNDLHVCGRHNQQLKSRFPALKSKTVKMEESVYHW